MTISRSRLPLGTRRSARSRSATASSSFRVWAPRHEPRCACGRAGAEHELAPEGHGVVRGDRAGSRGDRTTASLDGARARPTRVALAARGLRGPSRVVDPAAFAWTDAGWTRAGARATSSSTSSTSARSRREGTFDAAIPHLAALAALGVTAIELMPIAEFPGARGWGYDGVYSVRRAVEPTAARRACQRLVDAAHAAGLGVVLDVVYNHVGASGARALDAFGPYFTDALPDLLGQGDQLRRRAVGTPCASGCSRAPSGWVRDFHVDGLRLDAIHAIFDAAARHDPARARRAGARGASRRAGDRRERAQRPRSSPGRPPRAAGAATPPGPTTSTTRCARCVTDERDGYYAEFGAVAQLAQGVTASRTCTMGDYVDVPPAPLRRARRRPSHPSSSSSSTRTTTRWATAPSATGCPPAARRWRRSARCSRPFTPMLFMGEEYGEHAPFQFFTDHIDERIAGRRARAAGASSTAFAAFAGEEVPDPQDVATFERSKLDARARRASSPACTANLLQARRALPPGARRRDRLRRGRALAARAPRRARARSQLRRRRRSECRSASPARSCSPPTTRRSRATRRSSSPRPLGSAAAMTREVWPGRPFPLGATWDGRAPTSRSSPRTPSGVELCLFDGTPRRSASRSRERTAFTLALLPAGRRAGPALRLPRPRPLRARAGPPLQPGRSCSSTRTRRRSRARCAGTPRTRCPTRRTTSEDADLEPDDEDDAEAIPKSSSSTSASTGRATSGPTGRRGPRRSSTRPTSRGSPSATPTCARTCAAPTPAWPPRRRSPTSSTSASPRSSCCPSTTSPTRASCTSAGCPTTGATARSATSRRTPAYAATGSTGEQVREFKGMVKALHRAGIEVILDVVYNHTAEGNHLGPDALVQGRRQRLLLPADARRPAVLHGLHGHRQHAQRRPSERAAADHGLAALLGDRVPRRRLPLRPRVGAGARALRRRPPVRVLRRHPPGPGALAGEAHRRAVGRRSRRLPGRQLPGALERVERHLPRHDARLLARARPRSPTSPRASPARATSTSATGASRSPRSTSSPPTTASRSRDLVSYNEKHNEANLEDNRDGTDDNRSWNCGVEGPTDDPEIAELRPASSATSSPRCCSPRACRCCWAATRSAAPRAATTTPGARTTRSPGTTGAAATSATAAAAFTRAADRAARAAIRSSGAASSSRAAAATGRGCPTRGGSAPTGGA